MIDVVVVDANIFFSALLRADSPFSLTLLGGRHQFVLGESVLAELFKHKETIARFSALDEDRLWRHFLSLIRACRVEKEELVSRAIYDQAIKLCKDIDPTDTPHVAMTLHLDGRLWTGDKQLRAGLEAKGFDRFFDP